MQPSKREDFIQKITISRSDVKYQLKETIEFPKHIRMAKNVTSSEKCFFIEMKSLADEDGFVEYSAKELSNVFNVSIATINCWIKSLTEAKWIKLGVKKKNGKWNNFIELQNINE